jgi:hypothetical protein
VKDPKILSTKLYHAWKEYDPVLTEAVFLQSECQIDPEFMGFVEIYHHLSQIIPMHWTILDLGCAYAPQCWYFKDHKKYIGVDMSVKKRFTLPNCEQYLSSIRDWFKDLKPPNLNLDMTFGIMSYVPATDYEYFTAKMGLENLFVYYPAK